jgi:hypothetical protein
VKVRKMPQHCCKMKTENVNRKCGQHPEGIYWFLPLVFAALWASGCGSGGPPNHLPASKEKARTVKYAEEAKHLWQTYVPKLGQADTVQGELIRAIEKLLDEAQRNGNCNWDRGHEILCSFIRDTLCDSGVFDKSAIAGIKSDVARLDYEHPYCEDDVYDRLTDRIVAWYRRHPDPIPKKHNSDLTR